MGKNNLGNERIGAINTTRYGSEMVVLEYISNKNVTVRFLEHGNLAKTTWIDFCKGSVKNVYDKTFKGVGYIGEGIYKPIINGKETPQYVSWQLMLHRCYSSPYQNKFPSYLDCSVCEEWLNFQNYAKWYNENYYEIEGEKVQLDKDILVKNNKIYSPDTCIFVPSKINLLFVKHKERRGDLPIGVYFHKNRNKYVSSCSLGKGIKYLGIYKSPYEAFQAYKNYKEELIKQTAEYYKNRIPDKLYSALIEYIVEVVD